MIFSIVSLSSCKNFSGTEEIIQDLQTIKQDHMALKMDVEADNNKRQIPLEIHTIIDKKFNRRFFGPWRLKSHLISLKSVDWTFNSFKKRKGYGENKQRLPENWVERLEENANLAAYPNHVRKAITVANSNLRLLPTHKAHFTHFKDNGSGFPFDNIQNSAVAAGVPLLISHITKDGAWVLAETPFAYGWISIRDIAYAGPKFRSQYKKYSKYVAAIKEEVAIKGLKGEFIFNSNIGMIFPRTKVTKGYYHVLVPQVSTKGYAYGKVARIPRYAARTKPLPLSHKNLTIVANELLDMPYGWGGMYHNRDCSAMVKDLFTPFGLWLPRNSASQAKHGGIFIDLNSLTTDQKEAMILKNAKPYLTLIWLPGHIMLYVGEHEGQALVFHNIWGIRTTDVLARKIIGKSVITTLEPGKELPNVEGKSTLLHRVEGMTLLFPFYDT